MSATEFLAKMPKAELHLHLEGTVSPKTLWALAKRNHVALPVGSLKELKALYEFKDFNAFIELWLMMCRCLRRDGDFEEMVDAFAQDCARQNIRYAEVHFTPFNHELSGFGGRRALSIVSRRLEALEAAGGPVVRIITDIPAEAGLPGAAFTAQVLEETRDPMVVAIGLGGPEDGYPRSQFAPYFERARKAGYAAVAHAGETSGAEHVRQAVLDLKAVRVQHGVRAAEEPSVLALLAERKICCDVALTSNQCLKVTPDLNAHPLRRLLDAGVPVTLNTDDPPFFNTDLNGEYLLAHDKLGISLEELWEMNLNGLRYGLADASIRKRLTREFTTFALPAFV